MRIRTGDGWRYALEVGLLITANAARIESGLLTAWVFHAIGNSFLLLLPEIYRGAAAAFSLDDRSELDALTTFHGVMRDIVLDNPYYVEYVAPVVIAYILAHPKWNIYKSEWANEQLGGFGLDSIPHAMTAYTLSIMVFDTLAALKYHVPSSARWARQVKWAESHSELIASAVLALATTLYESGEYAIHQSEMKAVHNNPDKIAMEWSVEDTIQDIISNAVGGLASFARHRLKRRRKTRYAVPAGI